MFTDIYAALKRTQHMATVLPFLKFDVLLPERADDEKSDTP